MEPGEYDALFALEETHWWFRGIRAALARLLNGLGLPPEARILDAGCGTGMTLSRLAPRGVGFDRAPEALAYCARRGLRSLLRASVDRVPLRSDTFDAVLCVDVLECDGVDDARAVGELVRVTRPGGHVLLVVPAHRWLIDRSHHRAVHAVRRYSKARLRELAGPQARITYLYPTALPAIAAVRSWRRLTDAGSGRSDVRPIPGILNALLSGIVTAESGWLAFGNLPWGSSLSAVIPKP